MPTRISKTGGGRYRVSTPNQVHAKGTTKEKAEAQKRIIEEADKKKGRK